MSENPIQMQLSLLSWLGPTRHPPRGLLRALLVLVDLQDLRLFARETLGTTIMDSTTHERVPYLFSRTDEKFLHLCPVCGTHDIHCRDNL